ncbi:MAG: VTT domain-containing protein [Eubacteriales bacterium]|nr:VTT domain-containing protein [Eubacteriales bacterium]
MKNQKNHVLKKNIKYLPFVLMGVLIAIVAFNFQDFTVESILRFTPEGFYLAVLVFMGLYTLKSLAVVIPLALLYVAVGRTFPVPIAIMVNLGGLAIGSTIPYLIGRFSGKELVDSLTIRYPKAERINTLKNENEWIFTFIIRILSIIPYDIGSIVLGSFKVNYLRFIFISLMIKLPGIVAQTFLGATSQNIGSIGFWISLTASVLITMGYYAFYRWYSQNMTKRSVPVN